MDMARSRWHPAPMHRRTRSRTIGWAALAALISLLAVLPATAGAARSKAKTRAVMLVGNNWDGTADVIDLKTLKRVKRLNVIPDRAERMTEITLNPVKLVFFLAIRNQIGEGHDQLVDDMFASKDGRVIYVSRPSFADVIALDVRTQKIRWRTPVDGNRSDHMAISPDGRRLLVSASTANKVHVLDTRTGAKVGSFPSGDTPHESNFSEDGKRIYHASIGRVYTPTDSFLLDTSKGERIFEVIDAKTLQVRRRWDMGEEIARHGITAASSVRPMAIHPKERWLYVQLSFFSGFAEYDLKARRVKRMALLPLRGRGVDLKREDYPLDSAHHGLAMNPQGTKLCAAGTISDYAAIVRRAPLTVQRIVPTGRKPYWSETTDDGRYCFVSNSESRSVSVISWKTAKEVKRIGVGEHPQRMRPGRIRTELLR